MEDTDFQRVKDEELNRLRSQTKRDGPKDLLDGLVRLESINECIGSPRYGRDVKLELKSKEGARERKAKIGKLKTRKQGVEGEAQEELK